MTIQFTDLNNQSSTALKQLAAEKLQRLYKLTNNITNIHVTFDAEKLSHVVEANVQLAGATIHARSVSDDMYKAIDLLVGKLSRQLKKHKEKITDHR